MSTTLEMNEQALLALPTVEAERKRFMEIESTCCNYGRPGPGRKKAAHLRGHRIPVIAMSLLLTTVFPLCKVGAQDQGKGNGGPDAVAAVTDESKLKAIVASYVERRVAEGDGMSWSATDPRERMLLAELGKSNGIARGSLAGQLGAFAEKLARDANATDFQRATGAYVAPDFMEAERLATKAADEARNAEPLQRHKAILALELSGLCALHRSEFAKALGYLNGAAAMSDKARDPLEWARIHDALAAPLRDSGKVAEVEKILRAVVAIRSEHLGAEAPATLRSRTRLGGALFALGRYSDAESEYRNVVVIQSSVLGPEHPDTLHSRTGVANALDVQGKSAEAEKEQRDVIRILERVLGPEHLSTLSVRMLLGLSLGAQGKYADAEAEHRAVLRIEERVLGLEHPNTLKTRTNLAGSLYQMEDFATAESEYRAASTVMERVRGAEHPDTLSTKMGLSLALNAQEKYAEAEAELRPVIAIQEKLLGAEHPSTLASRAALAPALFGQGKEKDAEVEFRTVLKGQERTLGAEAPATLQTLYNLALVLERADKLDEARAAIRRALKGARKVLGNEHPETKAYEVVYDQLEAGE